MNHYEERLARDLEVIRSKIAALGGLLDAALSASVRAFLERDMDLAGRTVLGDRPVNRATREVDRLCHAFVARHLPSAGHLRYISSVLRLSIALERIGDYAVSISREAVQSRSPTPAMVARDIEMMAEQSRGILRQALKAFDGQNAELARGTMAMESQSNAVYRKVYRDLLAEGERHDVPIRDLFAFLVILGRLERISDQARNICEETVFAATGETKPTRPYAILFMDARDSGASIMARAIAQKAFPESGTYESGGWDPPPPLDRGLVEFMDRHGHDIRDVVPARADTGYEGLGRFDVVVALAKGARERITEQPYSTVLLDWTPEIAGAGPAGGSEEDRREEIYKRLASKIRELMETLCGEHAA
jgi:phosphate transport system protein